MLLCLLEHAARVDGKRNACDVTRFVRGEEQSCARPALHGTKAGIDSQPRTVDVGRQRGVGQVDVPFREALENFLQGDPAFEARQRRAEAEVRADAEREMLAGRGGC